MIQNHEIQRLQTELHLARQLILKLIPKDYSNILLSFNECKSIDEFSRWPYEATNNIIDLVQKTKSAEIKELNGRAICPLCGAEGQTYGQKGYSMDGGLFGHIIGSGNTYVCPVFNAAYKLSLELERMLVK